MASSTGELVKEPAETDLEREITFVLFGVDAPPGLRIYEPSRREDFAQLRPNPERELGGLEVVDGLELREKIEALVPLGTGRTQGLHVEPAPSKTLDILSRAVFKSLTGRFGRELLAIPH